MSIKTDIRVQVDTRKLQQLRDQVGPAAVRRALGTLAVMVERGAKERMAGPKSGAIYGGHQASAAGEAPAIDTGNLRNSIVAAPVGDGVSQWIVSVGAEYGAMLEFGTMDMEPRPFLRPAVEMARREVGAVVAAELRKVI